MTKPIIAIDGPAGAGKSTVAKMVADRLGYVYIDTGAMYRAVAWKVIENKVPISDSTKIVNLAKAMHIHFEIIDGEQHVFADGEDLEEAVRTPQAARLSSPVSTIRGVRQRMVEVQRAMAKSGGVVMEGRDIGTVVFPDAQVKVFLTASAAERARRRLDQLRERGVEADPDEVASDLKDRDLRDSSRTHATLKQAPDAELIDTDGMPAEQVVDAIVAIHNGKASG